MSMADGIQRALAPPPASVAEERSPESPAESSYWPWGWWTTVGSIFKKLEERSAHFAAALQISGSRQKRHRWNPDSLGSRNVFVIGTSQCNKWATGGNFQKSLDAHAKQTMGSVNISYDCGSGRYLIDDTPGWSTSAKNLALKACNSKSPPDVVVVFAGASEVTGDHGHVSDSQIEQESQQLVDAVHGGCDVVPQLLFVPPPMLASVFPEPETISKRYELLRKSMILAAKANSHTDVLDIGKGEEFSKSDFCSATSKECDGLHFCRLRPGKQCPLLEKVTVSMAESIKKSFAIPHHLRFKQVGIFVVCVLVLVTISSAAIYLGFERTERLADNERTYLPQISGLRLFACMWILAGHFLQQTEASTNFLERGPCAVSFFVVLSGFMTHYVYGAKLETTFEGQSQAFHRYMIDRFARILPTYYLGILFAFIAVALRGESLSDHWLGVGSAFCLLQSWTAVGGSEAWHSLNGPLWTLSALAFAWICYPALLRIWRDKAGKASTLTSLGVMLSIQCLLIAIMSAITYTQFAGSMAVYNGFRMCPIQITMQFVVGCFAAEMLRAANWTPLHQSWAYGLLGDLGFLSMPLLCAFLPRYEARSGVEIFFTAGFVFLQANLLVLSALSPGLVARFAAHKVPSQLGNYSFAIYALQDPFTTIFATFWHGYPPHGHVTFSLGAWSMYAIFMLIACGVISEVVEPPLVQTLKGFAAKKQEQGSERV
eukprot:TRINITY_DN3313_c2_g2_i1.p1 TRINITY_DN3313_c2_g2~~TRINITY_DN3313_c2_g2_i1.p1  ORF type:complete len:798 (+),score=117.06 TRINITY_DN3313_c2_g2_i1:252-2396(+)